MNLLDILSPECIKAPLAATEKRGIIDELVDLLAAASKVTDPAAVKESVWLREQARSTGIGMGLAIPHGKSPGVASLAMAIGKPAQPVDFQAIDGRPVKLVILLASPPDRASDHIQALARLSRLMTMEAFREAIYAAGSATEIFDLLRQHEQR